MWSCESTCSGGLWRFWRLGEANLLELACFSSNLTVRVRLVCVVGQEQDASAAGREPAREHTGGPGFSGGLGEHRLQPTAEVAPLGGRPDRAARAGGEAQTGRQGGGHGRAPFRA